MISSRTTSRSCSRSASSRRRAERRRKAGRAQLPSAVDAFVGREPELEALIERLAGTARLVTVTGPGGVGKTRLAIEAAHRSLASFPDGVHFVGLSAVPEAELVPSAILTTLELPTAPTRAVTDALIDHLRDGRAAASARQLRARPRCRGRNRELAGRLHESATARYQPKPPQIEGRAGVCRCASADSGGRALVCRTGSRGHVRVRAHGHERRAGGRDLPPPRWPAARDRACRGACANAAGRVDAPASRAQAGLPDRRRARLPGAPSDTCRRRSTGASRSSSPPSRSSSTRSSVFRGGWDLAGRLGRLR